MSLFRDHLQSVNEQRVGGDLREEVKRYEAEIIPERARSNWQPDNKGCPAPGYEPPGSVRFNQRQAQIAAVGPHSPETAAQIDHQEAITT